jgi:hypothetical protein
VKPLHRIEILRTFDGHWQWVLMSYSGRFIAISIPYRRRITAKQKAYELFGATI